MRGAAILAISTPLEETAFTTQLLERKDARGKNMFNVIQFQLVCDYHAKANPEKCLCRINLLPPWKPCARHLQILKFLEHNPDMLLREQFGFIREGYNRAFQKETLERAMSAPRVNPDDLPMRDDEFIWAMDPTGGGDSDFSLVGGYVAEDNRFVVMVLEACSIPSGNSKFNEMIFRNAMEEVRKTRIGETCEFVALCEANNARVYAHFLASNVYDFGPAHIHSDNVSYAAGSWTHEQSKMQMVSTTNHLLGCQQIVFARNLITFGHAATSPFAEMPPPDYGYDKLFQQLENFKREVILPSKPGGLTKFRFSGKGEGQNDDLVMGFMIAILHICTRITGHRLTHIPDKYRKRLGLDGKHARRLVTYSDIRL